MPSSRDELLARIYEHGSSIARRRRWRAGGVAAAVVLVMAAGAIVLGDDSSPPSTVAAGSSSSAVSTTMEQPSSTTELPTTEPVSTSTDTTTSTTVPPCRNSTDPACGPFFFDWPGPNHPATITITASPAQPHVGEVVTFTIAIDDPDGEPISRCFSFNPDDPGVSSEGLCADGVAPGFGAWDPPPPWHHEETRTVTFSVAGEHRVTYSTEEAGPGDGSGNPPRAGAEFTLEVSP